MGLKIIGGEFGGRNLKSLAGLDTRPTANRTREALFNMLAFKLKDVSVLDLYAGSGALGLEALSRGAASATFVENHPQAVEVLKENINLCKMADKVRLCNCKVTQFSANAGEKFCVVLMDPPYGKKLVDETLVFLAKSVMLNKNAIIVAEHEAEHVIAYDPNIFKLDKTRVYGKAALSFFDYIGD